MADVSKLKFENGSYNIKDAQARSSINDLNNRVDNTALDIEDLENRITNDLDVFETQFTGSLNTLSNEMDQEFEKTLDLIHDISVSIKEMPSFSLTNKTFAIQEAIDMVASTGGGTVIIPSGSYQVDTPIKMKKGIHLKGDGGGAITILDGGNLSTGNAVIEFETTIVYLSTKVSDLQIMNIPVGCYGVKGGNVRSHSGLYNLYFRGDGFGVRLVDSWYSKIYNCVIGTKSQHLYLDEGNGVEINQCMFQSHDNPSETAIYIIRSTGVNFHNSFIENMTSDVVILVDGRQQFRFKDNYVERISANRFIMLNRTSLAVIDSNYFQLTSGSWVVRYLVENYISDRTNITNNNVTYGSSETETITWYVFSTTATDTYINGNNFDNSDKINHQITITNQPTRRLYRGIIRASNTGSRGSNPIRGEMMFDLQLNKLIVYNGSDWVDANGTTV